MVTVYILVSLDAFWSNNCFQAWFLTDEICAFGYTYLSTIEWYVRSCVSEVSQSRGDFPSQYGNNNQAAHGPSNCKQTRWQPFWTAVTVPERVSSRDFKLIPSLGGVLPQKRGLIILVAYSTLSCCRPSV